MEAAEDAEIDEGAEAAKDASTADNEEDNDAADAAEAIEDDKDANAVEDVDMVNAIEGDDLTDADEDAEIGGDVEAAKDANTAEIDEDIDAADAAEAAEADEEDKDASSAKAYRDTDMVNEADVDGDMKEVVGEFTGIDAVLTGIKMLVGLPEDGTASLMTSEGLDTLSGGSETEAAVGLTILLRELSDTMGGAEDSEGFATFPDVLSGMSGGDDEENNVVPALLGPLQAQFSSSEGIQDPLRGTRHCDHHRSLQMHWASPAHTSMDASPH